MRSNTIVQHEKLHVSLILELLGVGEKDFTPPFELHLLTDPCFGLIPNLDASHVVTLLCHALATKNDANVKQIATTIYGHDERPNTITKARQTAHMRRTIISGRHCLDGGAKAKRN